MDRTIAAISTAMSPSGIGIIRMSGDDAWKIVSEIFRSGKKNLNYVPTHTIHHGYIYDEDELIDEVLVMMMRGPRTYTGEDTVEIDCHGGVFAMKRILDTVLKNGAVLAEPGEFTKRAFLNGKMDLSQAEAVMDVIQAKNEMALQSSITQLRGSVTKVIGEIRSKLLYQIAFIESALDDPEHIELDHYGDELLVHVKEAKEKIERLLLTASDGKIIREGIKTVIIGKPNAGKSSLLNMMVGENRAIVTDIAGTTRDVLEEYINLQGIVLKMIDTAGIRDTEDVIERIGVGKAIEYAMDADLVLYVVDSSVSMDENDDAIIEFLDNRKAIVLYNKTDLNPIIDIEVLKGKMHHPIIPISAKQEIGVDELKDAIKEMFFKGSISFNDEISITNVRHQRALEEAFEALKQVEKSIELGMPEDFFSIDLMSAYAALGRITGEEVGEDLVNEIFSKFCTGK